MEKELRINDAKYDIETRSDGKKWINFYAVVFNKLSRNMGGWYERIMPQAVDGADFTEWCAKKNHDTNQLLGTSWGGTATYTIDERGVKTSVLVGNSSIWNDTIEQITRGDLNYASFEFTLNNEGTKWERESVEGIEYDVRNIVSFRKIWDLSPVVVPAYPSTAGISVAKREFDKLQEKPIDTPIEREYNEYEALALQLQINN